MKLAAIALSCAALAFAVSASAQHPPVTTPPGGGPPTSAEPPQQLVDFNGNVVGDFVPMPGTTVLGLRYVLPDGDAVFLAATADQLRSQSGWLDPGAPDFEPGDPSAYFTTADCTGDAWIPAWRARVTIAKRQSISIDGLFGEQEMIAGCSGFRTSSGNFLFVTDPVACTLNQPSVPFVAYYGEDPDTGTLGCRPIPDGGMTPDDAYNYGPYRIYHRLTDLDAEFTPPFYVP